MTISEVEYDSEKELEKWIVANIKDFLPKSIYIPGSMISTVSGKGGVPDGFAFNLSENEWYVIEAELLKHGVWPHIAEQIIRFVVATQNPETRRLIRDKLFEHLTDSKKINEAAAAMGTVTERLLQRIELFIEGVDPQFVIFIDETNQDLEDMVHALVAPTRIFKIKKFLVNGKPEYYAPDRNLPSIETEPGDEGTLKASETEVFDVLGGAKLEASIHGFKCYRLEDGTVIHPKRSKYHEKNGYYWYGIRPTILEYCRRYQVTHIVFIMGDEGFAKVPLEIVEKYTKTTQVTKNDDGTVRHFHCLISPGPEPELYWSQDVPRFDLTEYYSIFR